MLIRLLRTYLRPYAWPLLAVVALQLVGTIASLYLPSLNADIIDNGVAKGDTRYIMIVGGVMLGVTLVQITCSITAVFFGARSAMGFGRDLRGEIFHRVGTFSDREVQHFGAPSLITRNTNDVTQVQTLVLMTCTLMVAAPIMCVGGIIMALKQDVGLSWLLVLAVPVLVLAVGLIVIRMVPQFRLMQKKLDAINRVLREQITGVRVVRAFVREPFETERFGRANSELTGTALRVGKLMALMFPTVMLVMNASSVAVLWFGGHRIAAGEIEVGTLTAGARPTAYPISPRACTASAAASAATEVASAVASAGVSGEASRITSFFLPSAGPGKPVASAGAEARAVVFVSTNSFCCAGSHPTTSTDSAFRPVARTVKESPSLMPISTVPSETA
jgi:ATP-binding cassette subfamily B protein